MHSRLALVIKTLAANSGYHIQLPWRTHSLVPRGSQAHLGIFAFSRQGELSSPAPPIIFLRYHKAGKPESRKGNITLTGDQILIGVYVHGHSRTSTPPSYLLTQWNTSEGQPAIEKGDGPTSKSTTLWALPAIRYFIRSMPLTRCISSQNLSLAVYLYVKHEINHGSRNILPPSRFFLLFFSFLFKLKMDFSKADQNLHVATFSSNHR
jgi:hypothetical protein